MTIRCHPYTLQFRYPFSLSVGKRSATPAVFVELQQDGVSGYGEAALPPYLRETQKSVITFISNLQLKRLSPAGIHKMIEEIDDLSTVNNAAKAAVEMALHDLWCKLNAITLSDYLCTSASPLPFSTYTIAMGSKEMMKKKISEAAGFRIFKIKLGSKNDRKIIETFLNFSKRPFCVDVNQGWHDKHYALDMVNWLHEKGALFAEQPMPKENLRDCEWLNKKSPIPIIADEAVQCMADMEKISGVYSGVNIKLMKSGGITEAMKMIDAAKKKGLKILIGCMSESSCGVTAAAHLSRLADWADLDGPYLIKNDPFNGMKVEHGRIIIPSGNGTGAIPNQNYHRIIFPASAHKSSRR